MIFNYIALGLAAVFFILCVTAVTTERKPHKRAAIRGFFRRLTISLREITLMWTVIISTLLLYISCKIESVDLILTFCTLGIFLLSLIILNFSHIFGRAGRKKRKKPSPYAQEIRRLRH